MDYGGRSQSVPVGDRGAVGNPFYSEKTQNQCLIEAARPSGLPVHDDGPTGIFGGPGMVGQSNAESQPSGKGRGGCSAGAMPAVDVQTVGTRVLKTEGKLPSGAKQSMGDSGKHGSGETNGLQQSGKDMSLERALEVELVDYLRQQNSKLQDEVAALKDRLEKSWGFGSSPWSTVNGSGSGSNGDSHRPGRQGSRTPRATVREGAVSPERVSKGDPTRFTPNGTKVPDGPPPEGDNGLPPVPPLPMIDDEQVGGGNPQPQLCSSSFVSGLYDTCESKPKAKNGDVQWKPHGDRWDDGLLSPQEAKQFWLEREVRSLKFALDRVAAP